MHMHLSLHVLQDCTCSVPKYEVRPSSKSDVRQGPSDDA